MSLFLGELGLHESQLGVVFTMPLLLSVFMPMVFGLLADKYLGKHITLVVASTAATIVFTMFYLPGSNTFTHVLIIYTIQASLEKAMVPLLDATCLDYLKMRPIAGEADADVQLDSKTIEMARKSMYGSERLWGAVGWACTHILLGFVLDYGTFASTLIPASIITTVVFVIMVIVDHLNTDYLRVESDYNDFEGGHTGETTESSSLQVDGLQSEKVVEIGVDDEENTLKALRGFLKRLFLNQYNCAFIFSVVVISHGSALVENLIFVFFHDELKISNGLMGLSVAVTVCFEIPLFAVGQTLLKQLGPTLLLLCGMLAYCVRVIAYTLITPETRWILLLIEPLHGVTYTMVSLASIHHITSLSPKNYEGFSQGALTSARAVGSSLGNLAGSVAMETYGPKPTYRVSACLVLLMVAILAITEFRAKNMHKATLPDPDNVYETEMTSPKLQESSCK